MLNEYILLQSAGSLAVGLLALIMSILQTLFFFKRRPCTWYAWSAAISFSALLYAVGVFLEYNALPGSLNRFSGLLEWTAIILLLHCFYGFTFSYLSIDGRRYHVVAGIWHAIVLVLLWFTHLVIADRFVARDFMGLSDPYMEPALGPLGPFFMLYAAAAGLYTVRIWIKNTRTDPKYRITYLTGMGCWFLLGIHDGLAVMGMPTLQYFMEYGFLGFSLAVLWVVFNNHLEVAAEEKYQVITQFANDCIVVIQDGQMVFGNPACGKLLDQSLTPSAPRDFLDIMTPEDRKTTLQHYSALLSKGHAPDTPTVRICKPDGDKRYVEIASSVIQYKNRPAVLAVVRDITQRKREEQARRESEEKVIRLRKMESLGILAGGVAHDLNNVLFGIASYPDLILSDLPEDSDLRRPIQIMQKSGQQATAMVEDLLTVARGVAISKELLDLNTIIQEYMDSGEYRKLLEFHPGVTVRTRLNGGLPAIMGSRVHIRKIVMNLVSNASEAIQENGRVTLSTTNRYVDRPIQENPDIAVGEYVILSVSDDGPGIPTSDLERIFEPFYTKKTMGRSGTGLGLALVWNAVKDHHGNLIVRSDPNGTTFELYFPAVTKEKQNHQKTASTDAFSGNGELILIVDDVESQREIISGMLERLGYRTAVVSSSEDAIQYVRHHRVDLVLVDMVLGPGMNGQQVYKQMVEIRPGQKAILMSGSTQIQEVEETQRLGAGPFLKKPITMETLGRAVKQELAR